MVRPLNRKKMSGPFIDSYTGQHGMMRLTNVMKQKNHLLYENVSNFWT